ncbi:hypothetical protein MKEN_00672500 [Mycena kentingensis (nom. inval.)]|nr:hypothetical protein MKEN_00672500 [Mycena kentingensis (nom. inval.)]
MAPKYLCCLPLRLGVLVISILNFLASAAVTGLLAALLVFDAQGKTFENDKGETVQVHLRSDKLKYAAIALTVVYGLVALVSLLGFIGAMRKKHSLVHAFSALCKFFLALQVAVLVAYVIMYFVDRGQFAKLCIGDSTDQKVIDACNSPGKVAIWALIVSGIIPLLFQAYGVYIVAAYSRKLREGDDAIPMYRSGPGYVKVAGEEAYPLTAPAYTQGGYADHHHGK